MKDTREMKLSRCTDFYTSVSVLSRIDHLHLPLSPNMHKYIPGNLRLCYSFLLCILDIFSTVAMFGPLGLSLAPYIRSSRTLSKWIQPFANWYGNISGYRKYGFKYDDLLAEETPEVQRALSRLTERENYDRAYRLKRASQASLLHTPLPKDQWVKPEEDIRYLEPHVLDVLKEVEERRMWDSVVVERK